MKRLILWGMIMLAFASAEGWANRVRAEDGWKAEFEDVCGKTQDAMSFPVAEVEKLVERCDRLKPQIEALEASPRKVYLKRLQLCRDLYAYLLESKAREKTK